MVAESKTDRGLVVIADDDEDIRNLVRFRLEHAGYEVATAENGAEAVSIALERGPALCIFDVHMPGMDGYTAIERLRADERSAEIPVILLTASVQERDMSRGYEVGAAEYMRKPFDPQELEARIVELMRRG